MKKNIHPQYHPNAKITCACGNSFNAGSTQEAIQIEICSACHPFYTGKQKLVDSARRVDKFQKRLAKKDEASKTRQGKKAKHAKLADKRSQAKKTATEK